MENSDTNNMIISDQTNSDSDLCEKLDEDRVLCLYCGRTFKNSIRCLGMCVADNDY